MNTEQTAVTVPDCPRCRTCKFWATQDKYTLTVENSTQSQTYRQCLKIPMVAELSDSPSSDVIDARFAGILAIANDHEKYWAYMTTQADFGCNMHEANTNTRDCEEQAHSQRQG